MKNIGIHGVHNHAKMLNWLSDNKAVVDFEDEQVTVVVEGEVVAEDTLESAIRKIESKSPTESDNEGGFQ